MKFDQLKTFWWITRLDNFVRVAEHLNITQSTVSARMQELEKSLGVKLFDRRGRNACLTTHGRLLLPHAEQALALFDQIRRDVSESDTVSGVLRIGAGEIVALSWFPAMLNRFVELYPDVRVELIVDLTINLVRMLMARQLDIIFSVGPSPSPLIIAQNIGHATMCWVASPLLQLGGRPLLLADLAKLPIYTLSQNSHLHTDVVTHFAASKIKPHIHGCNSITAIVSLVRAGSGIAVLPNILIEQECKMERLEIINAKPPVNHYEFFVSHERDTTNLAAVTMAKMAIKATTFIKD